MTTLVALLGSRTFALGSSVVTLALWIAVFASHPGWIAAGAVLGWFVATTRAAELYVLEES